MVLLERRVLRLPDYNLLCFVSGRALRDKQKIGEFLLGHTRNSKSLVRIITVTQQQLRCSYI